MQKHLNKIKNLPFYVQVIIAVAPSVILIALFIIFIFVPKNEGINNAKADIEKLNKEIARSEEKVKRLDALIVENEALKRTLKILKEQLPEEKEVSELLKQISELGLNSGLEILYWKPESRKTNPEGLYVEIPVNVNVRAQYHNLGVFFSHVSRLPRLVNISDIEIVADGKNSDAIKGMISAKFKARTFASVSEKDLAVLEPAK